MPRPAEATHLQSQAPQNIHALAKPQAPSPKPWRKLRDVSTGFQCQEHRAAAHSLYPHQRGYLAGFAVIYQGKVLVLCGVADDSGFASA